VSPSITPSLGYFQADNAGLTEQETRSVACKTAQSEVYFSAATALWNTPPRVIYSGMAYVMM